MPVYAHDASDESTEPNTVNVVNAVNEEDVKPGSTITFQMTGVVKSAPRESSNPNLGKYVNVQCEGFTTYRLAYLSEIVTVTPALPELPESDRILMGSEVFNKNNDGESWESMDRYFYNWGELVEFARRNNLNIFELNVENRVQL